MNGKRHWSTNRSTRDPFMNSSIVLPLLTLFLNAPAPAADSWPEFRGPTGQGLVASGKLPTEWGPDKNVAWKQEIPGKGWSSPVILDGRIYLTTAVPVDGSTTND